MKHAFLIMAHQKFDQLQLLIELLDDPRNDLYVHIDRKVKVFPKLRAEKSLLYLLKNRKDVRWGDVSQVECELALFSEARKRGPYAYYHLLSGIDLPIKPMEEIRAFFAERAGKEFVGFVPEGNLHEERVRRFHFITRQYRMATWLRPIVSRVRTFLETVVNWLISREPKYVVYKKGANWVSLTDDFLAYLLNRQKIIQSNFKFTKNSDEYFVQTEIWNSPFKDRIYCTNNEYIGCAREIDWKRGDPYTWGADPGDLDLLIHSSAVFARKFDMHRYPEIVENIKNLVLNKLF